MPDIFISYTHRDNVKQSWEKQGWVDLFEDALQERLDAIGGRTFSIFRDHKMRGSDELDDKLADEIKQSRLLVAIITPGYLNSSWCRKEVDLFCDAAQKSHGLKVGTGSRMVKAIKIPVDRDLVKTARAELGPSLGEKFFRQNKDGSTSELDPQLGGADLVEFKEKINKFAWDLHLLLKDLDAAHAPDPATVLDEPPVYLAETSSDLGEEREKLRRELIQFKHAVLPDEYLFPTSDYADRVREYLGRSRMSIHLIGKNYGITPENAAQSVIDLQYDLAGKELERRADFVRLTWMQPDIEASDDRQRAFVERLHDDPQFRKTPLSDLMTRVQEMLQPQVSPPPPPSIDRGGPLSVYLIYDKADEAAAKPFEDFLYERGFEVTTPPRTVDEQETLREDHEDALRVSDSVLVFQGQADERWRRTKLFDLKRIFGKGRTSPFVAAAVLLADPSRPDKTDFRSRDVLVISGLGNSTPAICEPFVEKLSSGAGTAG